MLKKTHNGKISKGKKHIDIPRKFIQEHIDRTVKLEHVGSSDQLADILTKPPVKLEHVGSSDQLADILTKPLMRKTFKELRGKIVL
ncbi:hypothetical protein QE152_g21703 [Popillia japonica]|uniref:Uncharacterized protein n=1 Tax=Popillia japonica TaxID=7064 RepID=A0AAW1KKY5_POPJA